MPFPEPYTGYSYTSGVKGSVLPGLTEISVTVTKDGERVVLRDLIMSGNPPLEAEAEGQ